VFQVCNNGAHRIGIDVNCHDGGGACPCRCQRKNAGAGSHFRHLFAAEVEPTIERGDPEKLRNNGH
jgi:hypothetical protein